MPIDYEKDFILLTSANGKQCNQLIPFLLPKWKHLRLAARSDTSRQQLLEKYADKSKAHIDIVLADLAQPDDCKRILAGVTAVYHIGPSFHPRETEIGYNMIESALANNIKHFVYSSVLHPSLRKLLNHDRKRYVEEALIESGLPYTILQPTCFMDMFPLEKLLSEEKPVYTARWDPDVPYSFMSLYDFAEASSKVLEEREEHFYATYQMVSTSPPMGWGEVCKVVGRVIGKDIRVETMPFQKTMERDPPVEAMFGQRENAHVRDAAQRLLLYYNYKGLVGNTNAMRWVLGREPTGWEEWVRGKMEELEKK